MASSTTHKAPSFVFEYLPKEPSPPSTVTDTASPTVYDRTSAFLSSLAKAVTPNPQLTVTEKRHMTLTQLKISQENYLAAKQKAGIAVYSSEVDDVARLERAIQGCGKDA